MSPALPVLGVVITCVCVCFQVIFQFVGWVGDQTLPSVAFLRPPFP